MSLFVDANIIVKAFTENKEKERCRAILNQEFMTSMLCLVEAQDAIESIRKDKVAAAKFIKSLFGRNCRILGLDKNLLLTGLRLHAATDFSIFDALHYAAALLGGCSEIVSYNRDFDNLPIKRTEP